MGSPDEIVAIVDEHNNVVGALPRREMRARGLPHRSTYVLVFNPGGQLFVQKRTMSKDVFPGYYDPAAGGVVLAGESYEEGARRELEEELGIRETRLDPLFEFYFACPDARVWGAAFRCVHDGPIILQEEEIESGAFMEIEAVWELQKSEAFTPDGLYALQRFLSLPPG